MRLKGLALAFVVSGCTGGLYENQGNDFPCDFTQPPGVRDLACAPGEVCGVDNLCRAFRYEGPQFEFEPYRPNGAPLPAFDGGGTLLHPGLLNQPILALSHRGDKRGLDIGALLMGTPGKATAAALTLGLDTEVVTASTLLDASLTTALAVPGGWAAVIDANHTDIYQADDLTMPSGSLMAGTAPLDRCDRLRTGDDFAVVLRSNLSTVLDPNITGEFGETGMFTPLDFLDADAGATYHPLEARYVPASTGAGGSLQALLMLSELGFVLRRPDGNLVNVTAPGTDFPTDPDLSQGVGLANEGKPTLRHDTTGSIWAFTRLKAGVWSALSTWRLDHSNNAAIARLWNDCSPCTGGRMVAFAPVLDGAPEVQVLCATLTDPLRPLAGESLSLTRVVGSAAIDETEECLVEPAEAPFSLSQVSFDTSFDDGGISLLGYPPFDDSNGGGVFLGGIGGQVWTGPSFTEALPLFLERTPLAFGTLIGPDGGTVPVALTDRYLAVPRIANLGFQVVDIHRATSAALAEDVVVSALMGQGQGWGLLSSGDIALVAPADAGHLGLSFGPRLVDARGQPALSPFFGEAATQASDAGLVSFIMTANDSLYFTPVPATTTSTQDVLPELSPQLTPASGAPIRSMTLERSAIGTDGITRVRGYLIAGRQLFVFLLSGSPGSWSATPITLQGGDPVEVWMDNPLGGLGRVGYSDGEVFTLPGGFPLVNALPPVDGGQPPQVLDYENMAGWPVAMTTDGLYEAHWDENAGRLENTFPDGGPGLPMDWRLVPWADGGTPPWAGKKARLQVVESAALQPFGDAGAEVTVRLFTLLVYTDDQVLEVGTLAR